MKKIGLALTALILLAFPAFAARRRAMTPPGDSCIAGVIAAPYFSQEVAVDDGYVYFADDAGGLFRTPKGGGTVTTLLTLNDGEFFTLIVPDGDKLFLGALDTTQTLGTIYSLPKSGGTPVTLVSGIITLNDLVVDDTSIYWISYGTPNSTFTQFLADGKIEKLSKIGASRTTLVSSLSEPSGIFVDDTAVYYTEAGGGVGTTISAGARSVPKNGGSVKKLTNGTISLALAGNASDLYFSTFNGNTQTGTIQRLSKSGGSPTTIEQATGLLTQKLHLTADKLYAHFVTSSTEGIRSIPLAGGSATHVVDSLLDTPRFAVDSCAVFYVTREDSVERRPR